MKTNRQQFLSRIYSSRLCIFDLDGTLVDLEKLHYLLFSQLSSEYYGYTLTPNDYQVLMSGKGSLQGFTNLRHKINKIARTAPSPAALHSLFVKRKSELLTRDFNSHVSLIDGIREFLSVLKAHSIRRAVATTTSRESCDLILDRTGLSSLIDYSLTIEDANNPKPDPDIFIKTMNRVHAQKSETVVFEDSLNGIQACKKAGLFCVGILSPGRNDDFVQEADVIIDSYRSALPLSDQRFG